MGIKLEMKQDMKLDSGRPPSSVPGVTPAIGHPAGIAMGVVSMLPRAQRRGEGGSGSTRMCEESPAGRTIQCHSYSGHTSL